MEGGELFSRIQEKQAFNERGILFIIEKTFFREIELFLYLARIFFDT